MQDKSSVTTIIQHLIALPDESFKEIELTPDQQWFWEMMRDKSALMGIHWYSILRLENDPLPGLVELRVIKESERISITAYVDFLQRLWELVHSAEPHVRKVYESKNIEYPFAEYGKYSSACLCIQIIQDLVNGQFEKSFASYQEFSLRDIAKLARHVQEPETKLQKLKIVKAIAKKHNPRGEKSWLLRFLCVCEQAKKKDPIVARRLEALLSAIKNVAKNAEKSAVQTRSTSEKIKPCSYVWKDSELLTASVYGGTYT